VALLVVRVLLPLLLCALSGEIDTAAGLLLRTGLDLPNFASQAARLIDLREALRHTLLWTGCGALLWMLLGWERSRREKLPFVASLALDASLFDMLYVKPLLSLFALASLTLEPTFPYALTLPVALTQDLRVVPFAAIVAALLAQRAPATRLPAPGAGALCFMAFLVYALLSPEGARTWSGHPGNEPKYLRMGLALASKLSLDVEEVSAKDEPLESVPRREFAEAARSALGTVVGESHEMLRALRQGPGGWGRGAIRAQRVGHETISGKEGGIYHVLAPGPSFFLAPLLWLDRALNLHRGTPGRLDLTLLAWNALSAGLVGLLYVFLREATGRPGLSALLASAFALTPPFLFFFFQFYPETLGALALAEALRTLLLGRRFTTLTCARLGVVLALLPWFHQKYLPVWGILVLMALVKAVDELVTLGGLLALIVPQALSLYLTFLYNFAITGSIRPDAMFLAWGREGVTSARVAEGVLGLLFDARYGLVPYAPIYLMAAAGLLVVGQSPRRLRWGLPVVLAYYLTVAAATNWSGSISNLGRFLLPVAPYLVVLVALATLCAGSRRGVLAVVLTLWAWTGLLARALWKDPLAANDSALLLRKSTFADFNVYIPSLFFRSWNYLGPGHTARVLAWLLVSVLVAGWVFQASRGHGGASPARALYGLTALILAAALVLERWPSPLKAPRFWDALRIRRDATAFVSGSAVVEGGSARASSGDVDILVSSGGPLSSLMVLASGSAFVHVPGRSPFLLPESGTRFRLPLETLGTFSGRGGAHETLSRQRFRIEGGAIMKLEAPQEEAPE
jgi:hypothetical protein